MRLLRALVIAVLAVYSLELSAQTADLVISKSGTESAAAGEVIGYSIFVFNNGPSSAQNVTVTDPLPAGTTFVGLRASDTTFSCSTPPVGSNGTVTCTAASFPLEGTVNFTLSVKTSPGAPNGSITNTATIVSGTTDPNPSDNTSSVTTGISGSSTASADLSVDALYGPTSVSAGATASFQVVLSNKGPSTAHHVQLSNAVPSNATFLSADVADPLGEFHCTTPAVGAVGTIVCTSLSFDQRGEDPPSFTFTFRVNNGLAAGTVITNAATVSGDESDPNTSNNTGSRSTTISGASPSADVSVATFGAGASFTVIARNAGPNDAAGVTLTDSIPSGSTFGSWTQTRGPAFTCNTPPAGGTGSITCTIDVLPGLQGKITEAEFALALNTSSQVVNSVTISSSTADPRPDNNSSSWPVSSKFSIDDVTVNEGNSGTTPAVFTVRLQPANATLTATVDYLVANATAIAGSDFVATSGTLTFRAGETQKTITVFVIGDSQPEGNEVFYVQLVNSVNASISNGFGAGTILDDDQGGPPVPVVKIGNVVIPEGNSGTVNATFTATLSFAAAQISRVRWQTLDGTATAGSDYIASSGELVFQPGDVSKTFVVPIIGDRLFEPDETFTINIIGTDNASVPFGQPAVCIIVNDDVEPPARRHASPH